MEQVHEALNAHGVRSLAGTYALNAGFRLTVRADGRRLFAQATGQGKFELFQRAGREFFARVTPLALRFEPGEPSPALSLQQAGREMQFVRE